MHAHTHAHTHTHTHTQLYCIVYYPYSVVYSVPPTVWCMTCNHHFSMAHFHSDRFMNHIQSQAISVSILVVDSMCWQNSLTFLFSSVVDYSLNWPKEIMGQEANNQDL